MSKITYHPENDGVEHINVYSKGRTDLGRLLSNFSRTPFVTPQDGQFTSVEGYWYWLATGRKYDVLRKLYGFEAKKEGKRFDRIEEPLFHDRIKEALRAKIEQNSRLRMLFVSSTLPFVHYYVFGQVVTRVPQDQHWQMEFLEALRKELQKEDLIDHAQDSQN